MVIRQRLCLHKKTNSFRLETKLKL